jgi:cell division GTPase FtsZ
MKIQPKNKVNEVATKPTTTVNKKVQNTVVSRVGLGKAGNNAIALMIARGITDLEKESTQAFYKEMSKTIYRLDNETEQELMKGGN